MRNFEKMSKSNVKAFNSERKMLLQERKASTKQRQLSRGDARSSKHYIDVDYLNVAE